jgi:hypothetical protein
MAPQDTARLPLSRFKVIDLTYQPDEIAKLKAAGAI